MEFIVFMLFFAVNILINMDHGSIPAATTAIQADFDLQKVELGAIGSLVYVGLTLGSFIAGFFFHRFKAKKILSVTIALTGISVALFPLMAQNNFMLYAMRLLSGFSQVFPVIYFPVWIDVLGPDQWKTLWLTFLQLSVALGVILGYAITAVFQTFWSVQWKWSFYIQGAAFIPFAILIQFIPSRFINYDKAHLTGETNFDANASFNQKGHRWLLKVFSLVNNRIYLISMMCVSCLYFVVTGIQFWASDYLLNVMEMQPSLVFPTYAITTITGPTLGVVTGGAVCHKTGGYRGKNAIYVCASFGFMGCLCAIPVPFISSFPGFIAMLWLVLFFGAAVMPAVTGIMISSVPSKKKALANSIASMVTNTFGYLPAPFLYGLVCQLTGGDKSPYGLMCVLYVCLIAEVLIVIGILTNPPSNTKPVKEV